MNNDSLSIQELFKPLVLGLGKEHEEGALKTIEEESPEGMLAWGVRSGYLLWTRQNTGKIPTKLQIAQWFIAGKQR